MNIPTPPHFRPVPAKTLLPVSGLNRSMRLTAAEALLELARVSRSPKDRSIAAVHRWWAFLRYLGFFDKQNGSLVVSSEGRSFVNNQRRIASEELGVGFSILVGKRWIRLSHAPASVTSVTDVEIALGGSSLGVSQLPGRTKRPDWVLTVRDPSTPWRITNYLLESKGTASARHARHQLSRAARQLTAVTVGGHVPKGLAVSTVTGKDGISYLALDPGEELPYVEIDPSNLGEFVQQEMKLPKRGSVELSPAYFASASTFWSLVGLADFARNDGAVELHGGVRRQIDEPEERVNSFDTGVGPVDGVRQIWRTGLGDLTVVVGVASRINEHLESTNLSRAMEEQGAFAEELTQRGDRPPAGSVDEALAASNDGAVMSIRLAADS